MAGRTGKEGAPGRSRGLEAIGLPAGGLEGAGGLPAGEPVLAMWVSGTPRPKQSGRAVAHKRGRVRFITHTTANKLAGLWHRGVIQAARAAAPEAPEAGAVRVRLRFVFGTAKRERWGQPHTGRPDADNLGKLALDGLTAGGWIADDAQGAAVEVVKVWGERPGMGAEVWRLVGEPGGQVQGQARDGTDGLPGWLSGLSGAAMDGEPAGEVG